MAQPESGDATPADEDPGARAPMPGARRATGALRRGLCAVGGILLVLSLVHSRTLVLGEALYLDDISTQYVPWHTYAAERRMQGDWLSLCRETGGGMPIWANGQTAPLYPGNLIFMLPLDATFLFSLAMFVHYVLAALGVYCLARRLGLPELPSAVSGLTFALGGFMTSHQIHYANQCATGWLPWMLVGMIAWRRGGAVWGLPLAAVGFAVMAMSHPQIALHGVFAAGAFVLVAGAGTEMPSWRTPARWRMAAADLGGCGLAAALGAMLAGTSVWGALVLAQGCHLGWRSGLGFVTSYAFAPRQLVTLLFPYYYGTPWGEEYWGPWSHHETCAYVGVAALALCGLAIPAARGKLAYRGLLVVAGIALMMAMGPKPIYAVIARLPLLGAIRIPGRWLVHWCLCFSLLCGMALTGLGSASVSARFRRRAAILLAAAAMAMLAGVLVLHLGRSAAVRNFRRTASQPSLGERNAEALMKYEQRMRPLRRDLVTSAAVLLALAAVTWRWLGRSEHTWKLMWAVALLVVADVGVFSLRYNLTTRDPPYRSPPALLDELPRSVVDGRTTVRFRPQSWELPIARAMALNTNVVWGIPMAATYDPISPPVGSALRAAGDRKYEAEVAAAFGISRLLTDGTPEEVPSGWRLLARGDGAYVYENTAFRGPAWVATRTTGEETATRLLADPAADAAFLLHAPEVARASPLGEAAGEYDAAPRAVRTVKWDPEEIVVEVAEGQPGYLVIACSKLPGWEATLDGQPTDLLLANRCWCAVSAPAGAQRVVLRYTPAGAATGTAFAIAAAIILAIISAVFVLRGGGGSGDAEAERGTAGDLRQSAAVRNSSASEKDLTRSEGN